MHHKTSEDDIEFRRAFEACEVSPDDFDHTAHVRLAYVYLCGNSVEQAAQAMKSSLLTYLAHLGADPAKYHETMTRAWVMAVDHFMAKSGACKSTAEFMRCSPQLLDSKIMLTHYSVKLLFSPEARQNFLRPDIQEIPPL